jgi:hypothetical protein
MGIASDIVFLHVGVFSEAILAAAATGFRKTRKAGSNAKKNRS